MPGVVLNKDHYGLECHGVTKRFGDSVAVSDMTFTMENGTVLVLLGPSGCGKTTTLRLIAGFEIPDSGVIHMGGNPIAGESVFLPPERRQVGMVFQDYALFPHLNARRNIEFGISRRSDRKDRANEVMELLGIRDISGQMPHELSGGQQQRVALARALAPRPEVLLMDEPFSNLDAQLRARVRSEIKTILKENGTSAIFVTHDQEEAFALADEIGVMLSGSIAQIGSPRHIYNEPSSVDVATCIGDATILKGVAKGKRVQSELGNLPMRGQKSGDVQICLRPEMINVETSKAHDFDGTVIGSEFYGPFQTVSIRLSSGTVLRTKVSAENPLSPDSPVKISIDGPVATFLIEN